MGFDPWTLAFQLLNFAVLLLVLFRLLFKPVREIMAKRAAQVQAALDAAATAHAEAEEIRAGLALERERVGSMRDEMLENLKAEIEEHRQRRLAGIAAEAKEVLDRGRAVLESEGRKADEELRERARRSVAGYAAALLAEIADVEIHRALLRRLPAAFAGGGAELAGPNSPGEPVPVAIESAFPLTEEETAGLRALLEKSVPVAGLTATTEPGLLAGVRLRAADRLYDFSLKGQLEALAAALKALPLR
jgi:F-type H+-transporting ATPase subunit b